MNIKNEIEPNTLVIPIAVSGTGKSVLGKMLCKKYNDMKYVSSDEIREEFCNGDATNQSKNEEVFKEFYRRIEEGLKNGNRVYADATNLNKFTRAKLYEIMEKYGSKVKILFFNVEKEQSKIGNQTRERHVPKEVLEKQYEQLKKAREEVEKEVPAGSIIDIIRPKISKIIGEIDE